MWDEKDQKPFRSPGTSVSFPGDRRGFYSRPSYREKKSTYLLCGKNNYDLGGVKCNLAPGEGRAGWKRRGRSQADQGVHIKELQLLLLPASRLVSRPSARWAPRQRRQHSSPGWSRGSPAGFCQRLSVLTPPLEAPLLHLQHPLSLDCAGLGSLPASPQLPRNQTRPQL